MSLWEYKVITSGKGGFASPALLEKFLNDLGREEWEIIEFHSQPDNFLVFTGLARRSTQRDWTLEDAAAAAAKAEADKLRAEFEAKFKAGTSGAVAAAQSASESFIEEKIAPEDGFRKPVDTSHDADAEDEPEKEVADWDAMPGEDELPTFFDAIRPHMRRNQRGPGMSVGVDYLAKKWDQSEEDIKGALVECGFVVPEDEDADPEYLEFEGDLYWVNINRRGELWINTKEKPRPAFRAVKGQKVAVEEEKPEGRGHKAEGRGRRGEEKPPRPDGEAPTEEASRHAGEPAAQTESQNAKSETGGAAVSLPTGPALLDRIRPLMRRNRRGPGGSGSVSFLSRALKCRESDLVESFKAFGLMVPSSPSEKPTNVEIGDEVWWLNADSRNNVWINGREKKSGEMVSQSPATETPAVPPLPTAPEGAPATPLEAAPASAAPEVVPAPEVAPVAAATDLSPAIDSAGASPTLATVRPLMKETRSGVAAKLERVAEGLGRSPEETVALLVAAGLTVPEKPREKPAYTGNAGELFWLTRNARGELWLNAKPAKPGDTKSEEPASAAESTSAPAEAGEPEAGEQKPRRPRSRKKPSE